MVGSDPVRERELGTDLLTIFTAFWTSEGLSERSETTQRRHSGSLHALGGHLVTRGLEEDQIGKPALELLTEEVDFDEGPFLFQDDETWQRELDATCRKLRRYLAKTR
jgi:hypothetical protein